MNESTIIGASGELSDFQYIMDQLSDVVTDDFCMDDGVTRGPKEIFSWLSRVLYGRRNKYPPPSRRCKLCILPAVQGALRGTRKCTAKQPPPPCPGQTTPPVPSPCRCCSLEDCRLYCAMSLSGTRRAATKSFQAVEHTLVGRIKPYALLHLPPLSPTSPHRISRGKLGSKIILCSSYMTILGGEGTGSYNCQEILV